MKFESAGRAVAIYEVVLTVGDGRALWRPDAACVAMLDGVIGRAQALFDFELYAYSWPSTHAHLLIGVGDLATKASVLEYLNGNVARETNRLRGRTGPVLARRNEPIQVADEVSAVARLKYVIGQATAAHIVARPEETPFASANRTLLRGEPIMGRWLDRAAMYRAGPGARAADFVESYPVTISPLPHLRGDPDAYRALCRRLANEVAEEALEERKRTGRRLQGASAARCVPPSARLTQARTAYDDEGRAVSAKQSAAPCVHGCRATQAAWWVRYEQLREGVARATESWRRFLAGEIAQPDRYPPGTMAPGGFAGWAHPGVG